jgi:hypothetical protein
MKVCFRICGTYEQLEYWPNGFDDFFVGLNSHFILIRTSSLVFNCDTLSYNDC